MPYFYNGGILGRRNVVALGLVGTTITFRANSENTALGAGGIFATPRGRWNIIDLTLNYVAAGGAARALQIQIFDPLLGFAGLPTFTQNYPIGTITGAGSFDIAFPPGAVLSGTTIQGFPNTGVLIKRLDTLTVRDLNAINAGDFWQMAIQAEVMVE